MPVGKAALVKDTGTKKTTTKAATPVAHEAPQRSVLQEGREAIQLMREVYPAAYDIKSQYDPQFARLEVDTANVRGEGQIAGVNRYGRQIYDSLNDANPTLAAANQALTKQLGALGPSDLERELTRQAGEELALGGRLTPEELRLASQGSRAAFSARGIANSSPAAVNEVLSRVQYSDARKADRRAFAAGVDAQATQREAGDRAFANNSMNTAGSYYDPYQRLYGTGGSAVSGQVQGPSTYQPYLSAANEVGASNLQAALAREGMAQSESQFQRQLIASKENAQMNAQWSADAAKNNSNAALTSAGIGAAAMVLAAFI